MASRLVYDVSIAALSVLETPSYRGTVQYPLWSASSAVNMSNSGGYVLRSPESHIGVHTGVLWRPPCVGAPLRPDHYKKLLL
jgi:hypothetical protein